MSDTLKKVQLVLTEELHTWLIQTATQNKLEGKADLDSISKIARRALEDYRTKTKTGG